MNVKKATLDNGVKLVLVDMPDTASVSVVVFAKVGSRYEKKDVAGISHFTEHCLFKGSKNHPSTERVSFDLEGLGASIDAGTSLEYTYYSAKVIKENFLEALDIIADVYVNPLFPEDEIAREKGVVIEEIRMYEDNPMSRIVNLFTSRLWKGQPIGRKIAGTMGSVRSLKKDDLVAFKKKYYSSGGTEIVIAGDLSSFGNVANAISDKFSGIVRGKGGVHDVAKKNLDKNKVVWKTDNVEQTHLILGAYGVDVNDERKFAAAVGNTILGQGFSSRLFRIIRGKYGLAYYVNSGNLSYTDTGAMYIRAGVDNKRIAKAIEEIANVLNQMIGGEIEEHEIARAKRMLTASLIMDLDSTDSIAAYLGMQELLVDKPLTIDQLKEKIDAVTKEEIEVVLKEIFSKAKLLTLITPQEKTSGLKQIIDSIGV